MEMQAESNKVIDFVKLFKPALALSLGLALISIVCLVTRGLNLGIDFTGGVMLEAQTSQKLELQAIRTTLEKASIYDTMLQDFGERGVMIRVAQSKAIADEKSQKQLAEQIKTVLTQQFGEEIQFQKTDFVGAQVGRDLVARGLLALLCAFAVVMVYIWIRFDWQFGVGAMLGLAHDTILLFGFYALTGLTFDFTAIIAILTVVGYSVNDSVVLYDRIRENLQKKSGFTLAKIINLSTKANLKRTLLTSGSTIVAILALALFGGKTLASFSYGTLFGVIIGTYSSIFIATPVLVCFFDKHSA